MLSRHYLRRPRRPGEWSGDKAVTYIVTLAASDNVTLAAARVGISRKSAYALKCRDPAFAAAWAKAVRASKRRVVDNAREPDLSRSKGDEGNELHDPQVAPLMGNSRIRPASRPQDAALRDSFFAALATRNPDLAAAVLARTRNLP